MPAPQEVIDAAINAYAKEWTHSDCEAGVNADAMRAAVEAAFAAVGAFPSGHLVTRSNGDGTSSEVFYHGRDVPSYVTPSEGTEPLPLYPAPSAPDARIDVVIETIDRALEIARAMRVKHGDPLGSDYQQGTWDHGHRIEGKLSKLKPGEAAATPVSRAFIWNDHDVVRRVRDAIRSAYDTGHGHGRLWSDAEKPYKGRDVTDEKWADIEALIVRWAEGLDAPKTLTFAALEKEILKVDRNRTLSDLALAEALMPFIENYVFRVEPHDYPVRRG
jgi:hypothetical protein